MDKQLFKKIAEEVECDWRMSGLSDGLYYAYALEVAERYFSVQQSSSSRPDESCGS